MTHVLIVDDEPAIRRLLRGALERAGLDVVEAANASAALSAAKPPVTIVLLDLGLPGRDGLELIPLLRSRNLAVIVLTARHATDEKVTALDLGADDYVTKPFDTEELLARIRVALRHRSGAPVSEIVAGDIVIDIAAHRVTRAGQDVKLTRKEFALLSELARHVGKVLTHGQLLRTIWGEAHIDDVEYLRVAMRSLRLKLENQPTAPRLLINEPGVGYRLVV